MTRPTRGSARTARTVFLLALAVLAGAGVHRATTPMQPLTVHISGDGATQLADRLFTRPSPARADTPQFATTQVIAVRRWQNL